MHHADIIDRLGGTCAVADLFGIRPPSVSEWRKHGIPEGRLIRLAPILEARGIVSRRALFPRDWRLIWPELSPRRSGRA